MLRINSDKWILYPRSSFVRKKCQLTLALISAPALVVGAIAVFARDPDTLTASIWLLAFTWICGSPAIAMIAMTRLKLNGERVSLIGPLGITWWGCNGADLDIAVAVTGYKDRQKVYVALNRASDRLLGAFACDTFDTPEMDRLFVAAGCRRLSGAYRYRGAMIILI